MSFISYAQNFEDVMLCRALKHVENGFYIDVGANHPLDDSVTKAFYNYGWSGINIEPERKFFDLLELDRERDINLEVAVSNQVDDIKLFIFDIRGWSTNDQSVAEQHKAEGYDYQTKIIKTKSLDQICEENSVTEVHFLKIDVEGAEKDVLESFSFHKIRPWIILIEATKPNTTIDVSHKWEHIMFEHQYSFAYFDGINKFYVAKEHRNLLDFFGYPPNAFDDFISINQFRAEARANLAEANTEKAIAETAAALTRLDTAQEQYHAIIDSRSWKITKPLRTLLHAAHQYRNSFIKQKNQQLLVDVSQIYSDDNQTGIQRVIHNIIDELSTLPMKGYTLLPIYATMEKGYHYTSKFNSKSKLSASLDEQPVTAQKGDIFLGLDLTAHLFPKIEETLEQYRQSGVSINYVIYDIIPLLHPEFTTEGMDEYFKKWLNGLIKYADRLICISQSVADELQNYTDEHYPLVENKPQIVSFHLGAGIGSRVGAEELTVDTQPILDQIEEKLTFLMVGTVEPRKGHYQVLSAFEKLWSENYDINLVIVGKKGWIEGELLDKITNISKQNQHLIWLHDVSDKYLNRIYASSNCLIMASETEGFGLPMIEAAKYGLPIITRDIPVFREIAGTHAFYFDDNREIDTITEAVTEWTALYHSDTHPRSGSMAWLTWRESALQLLECLNIKISL